MKIAITGHTKGIGRCNQGPFRERWPRSGWC